MSNKLKPITDFFGDLASIPVLIIFGPVMANPVVTKMLILKVAKVVLVLFIFLIILTVGFVALLQQNEAITTRALSSEADSYLADYKAGKNKTIFSEQLHDFINKYEGKLIGDPNGYYEGQCVSLVKQWQNHIEVPFLYWYDNYPAPAYTNYLEGGNSIAIPTSKYSIMNIYPRDVTSLEAGDLVILTGAPSHTAIATGRVTDGKYEVFEQNAPNYMNPPNLSFYNNSTFIGAIRYKSKV